MAALRLIFFGTPEIAVPSLERLIAGPHDVVGVVSQPDRARGRGRKESPSPVAAVALREEIPLLRPEKISDDEALSALRALRPDVGVVVAFGQFLPKKLRELPSRGYLINAHASLLPKYRGASPIAQAILEGESETGVSVMRIEKEMDAGPVALVMEIPIEARENTAELSTRLAEVAATAIEETLVQIERETVEWTEQDPSRITIAPKLEKSDALLDLSDSALRLACRIHALSPKPGALLRLIRESEPVEGEVADGSEVREATALKVSRADVVPFVSSLGTSAGASTRSGHGRLRPTPGTIELDVDGCALRIATGEGWLVPLTLQRPGGKPLATKNFLRGFAIGSGMRFACPTQGGGTAK